MVAKTCALVERLETSAEPRRPGENRKHRLVDIIILGFCGVLAGCDAFVEMAAWAKVNEAFFRAFLELPHGIPAHDTFNRVLAMLKPTTLPEVLRPWLLERRGLPGAWSHLDGKTLRHTRHPAQQLKALHGVSAWAGQPGITLGQVAVEAKSDEITALPQLLELLDLHDKIVTTDALGGQKEIAKASVEGGGDYILAVKDNPPTVHAEMQAAFAQDAASATVSTRGYTTANKGPGRHAHRTVRVLPARRVLSPAQVAAWLGVLTVVLVTRVVWCEATGVGSTEVSYFLSSLRPNARRIGAAIRAGTGALRMAYTGC